MDAYLESLVRKGEVAEKAEAVIVAEEPLAKVEEVVEPVKAEKSKVADEKIDEAIKTVQEIAEKASDEKKEVKGKSPKQDAKSESMKGKTISVTNIRVHNIPDPKSVFKIISGNIVVGDKINDMYQIDYVKPGFGLVKGFTADLK